MSARPTPGPLYLITKCIIQNIQEGRWTSPCPQMKDHTSSADQEGTSACAWSARWTAPHPPWRPRPAPSAVPLGRPPLLCPACRPACTRKVIRKIGGKVKLVLWYKSMQTVIAGRVQVYSSCAILGSTLKQRVSQSQRCLPCRQLCEVYNT